MKTGKLCVSAAALAALVLGAMLRAETTAPAKVLIVTGIDYPGHHWKETTPVLRQELERDGRLEVEVLEDPYRLGAVDLTRFNAVVLHFMNWEKPDPGPAAQASLKAFAENGGGLVSIHFACGAFGGWPEYAALIGRIWDRTNTHDPRGPFTVRIIEDSHPITRTLPASFETDDELYTCLAGDKPVELLAVARSKVTGRDHPMALAHRSGKGRVFLTPLGHDVKALRQEGAAALIRRGTAWAAGLDPQ